MSKVIVHSKVRDVTPPPRIRMLYQGKFTEAKPLMLWVVNGKGERSSLSDFSLALSYDWIGEIVIPVINDRLDISKAHIPKNLVLEEAK